jgi:acetate kinase
LSILVINAGSSSVKFTCLETRYLGVLASGAVERLGTKGAEIKYGLGGSETITRKVDVATVTQAVDLITSFLRDPDLGIVRSLDEFAVIGHRIVHGGEKITAPVLIDGRVKAAIRACFDLAPLHNPSNLEGIEACERIFPGTPQVGVFDTAFHATLPPSAYRYAIPIELYEVDRVRRYGFHGTSHKYVAHEAARYLDRNVGALKTITCHLGNGSSIAAVRDGVCVDTSMGFSPLEGLVMGTRCGDLDPAIVLYLLETRQMSIAEVSDLLNRRSGLLGLAAIGSSDMRDVEEAIDAGDPNARLAFEVFCHRVRKYIGAYTAVMGGVDVIVFTGGIGENSSRVRAEVCRAMGCLGIAVDERKNAACSGARGDASEPESSVRILVIPTNEEVQIAREALDVVGPTSM